MDRGHLLIPKSTPARHAAIALAVVAVVSCAAPTDETSTSSGGETAPTSHVSEHSTENDIENSGASFFLDPASVMGRPDRIISGPQGNEGQFVVECDLSHLASDDPILLPDRPGESHLHAFFGNRLTGAASRAEDLLGGPTSCDDWRDTAAYWVPVLMADGEPIEPVYSVAYYRAGIDVDPQTVVPYPPGLTMIAGDPLADSGQPLETVSWSCGQGARRGSLPPVCPTGSDVRLSVTFPDCWNGENLDSPGHRRHLHYSSAGMCPTTHPVAIPQLVFAVHFPVDGDISSLRLSSGTLGSGHADFVNAWDQEHLEHEVDLCIRQQNVCGISSGRRPA